MRNPPAISKAIASRVNVAIDCPCNARNCGPADSPAFRNASIFGVMLVALMIAPTEATAKKTKSVVSSPR